MTMSKAILMPQFFLPPKDWPMEPVSRITIDTFGGAVLPIIAYPIHTGPQGKKVKPKEVSVLEGRQIPSGARWRNINNYLSPHLTLVNHLWYNSRKPALEMVGLSSGPGRSVVIPCANAGVVQAMPESVIIGYNCRAIQTMTEKAYLAPEDLEGREVCLMGGVPWTQWLAYCLLVSHGITVVGVRLSGRWQLGPRRGKKFTGPKLRELPIGDRTCDQASMDSIRNILGHWTMGIMTMNRHRVVAPAVSGMG